MSLQQFNRRVMALTLALCGCPVLPALAGDCDGMSHYQYDHGQCTDMTGDMLGVMERSGDESYRMDQQRLQSERQPVGGGAVNAGGGGTSARTAQYLLDVTGFQRDPSLPSAVIAAQWVAPPRERPEVEQYFQRRLSEYLDYAPQHGFRTNLMPDALFFALQAAYIAYDGERLEPSFAGQTQILLMKSLAAKPALASMTGQTKQVINDQFGILGVAMLVEADRAHREHNARDLRDTRAFAERFITVYGGIDPKHVRINQLVCFEIPGPCEQTQYFLSGGRMGRLRLLPMTSR